MRATLLVCAIGIAAASAAMAFPVASPPTAAKMVRIHGCHHTYGQDVTGWHRHDGKCQTLRGLAGRKNRPAGNT